MSFLFGSKRTSGETKASPSGSPHLTSMIPPQSVVITGCDEASVDAHMSTSASPPIPAPQVLNYARPTNMSAPSSASSHLEPDSPIGSSAHSLGRESRSGSSFGIGNARIDEDSTSISTVSASSLTTGVNGTRKRSHGGGSFTSGSGALYPSNTYGLLGKHLTPSGTVQHIYSTNILLTPASSVPSTPNSQSSFLSMNVGAGGPVGASHLHSVGVTDLNLGAGIGGGSPNRSVSGSPVMSPMAAPQHQSMPSVSFPIVSHATHSSVAASVQPSSQHPPPMTLSSAAVHAQAKLANLSVQTSPAIAIPRTIAASTAAAAASGATKTAVGPLSPPHLQVPHTMTDEVREWRAMFRSTPNLNQSSFQLGDTLGTGTFGRVRIASFPVPAAIASSEQSQSEGAAASAALAPASASTTRLQYFALKILKKSEIIRLKQVEHIKAEKAILTRIAHPFIVHLYAAFQDERHLYMTLEYVVGGELFSQLRKVGRFSNETAKFYAAEIILALEYLHAQNIVYRDLKPENLLIDREGHIKITDFGFAKVVEDRTWTLCGTPEYLAPEIIQSKGHGAAVDWWALGVLIFEMLAGYPPFYDENPFGIYQKILKGNIEFPKHMDANARDLIKRLLTADRTKRFGCLQRGAEDIRTHSWFAGLDWLKVYKRKYKPPFVPAFRSAHDTSNFDKYPDSRESAHPAQLSDKDKALFTDF